MQGLIINKKELFFGLLCLAAGTMEYLTARSIDSSLLLLGHEELQAYFHHLPNLYGSFGTVAPDFFHPLAFALISMAFVSV